MKITPAKAEVQNMLLIFDSRLRGKDDRRLLQPAQSYLYLKSTI